MDIERLLEVEVASCVWRAQKLVLAEALRQEYLRHATMVSRRADWRGYNAKRNPKEEGQIEKSRCDSVWRAFMLGIYALSIPAKSNMLTIP